MKNAMVDSSTTSSSDTEPKAKRKVASQDAARKCQGGARTLTVTVGIDEGQLRHDWGRRGAEDGRHNEKTPSVAAEEDTT